MIITKKDKELFMFQSNEIEGENWVNSGDIKAVDFVLEIGCGKLEHILALHNILGKHLKKDWVGKLRTCDVRVGKHLCPSYLKVPKLMTNYITQLPYLDSYEAHNRFERIHPFQDLNGRMGRLIWLSKAVKEGYDFSISFLHRYYYQTLEKFEGV